MKVIYMCHPLAGPDRPANIRNAMAWGAWITREFSVAVVADWIWMAQIFDESPENRARGLACDLALIARCDEVWLVGGRVSPGMQMEADEALRLGKVVIDLTPLGALPPLAKEAAHG